MRQSAYDKAKELVKEHSDRFPMNVLQMKVTATEVAINAAIVTASNVVAVLPEGTRRWIYWNAVVSELVSIINER